MKRAIKSNQSQLNTSSHKWNDSLPVSEKPSTFNCGAWHCMVRNISGQLRSSVLPVYPHNFLSLTSLLALGGQCEKQKPLMLYKLLIHTLLKIRRWEGYSSQLSSPTGGLAFSAHFFSRHWVQLVTEIDTHFARWLVLSVLNLRVGWVFYFLFTSKVIPIYCLKTE